MSANTQSMAFVEDKIRKFETFIDEKLRPDLEKVLKSRELLYIELG